MDHLIDRGRAAFDQKAWSEARKAFASCSELGVDDLERLAIAEYLLGADDECAASWERAHLAAADLGDSNRAAHFACWLGITYLLHGEVARAGGWLARAERFIERTDTRGSALGLLLVPAFLDALGSGDQDAAEQRSDGEPEARDARPHADRRGQALARERGDEDRSALHHDRRGGRAAAVFARHRRRVHACARRRPRGSCPGWYVSYRRCVAPVLRVHGS